MAVGSNISATIRFMFASDVSGFDLGKINTEISATKVATQSLTAAFKLLQIGMAATLGSAVAIVMPFSIASSSVGELDQTLRLAAAAAEDTRVYDDMMGVISDLAIEYGVAKNEIAGAVFEMAKAGVAFADMNEMLEPAVQLATANMMDLSDAMSVAITMFNLFEETGYDATQMIEMLDKAATISILDVDDLPEIIEQTGSAFAMASVPLEEYLALMASLSQEGITMGARHGSIISQMLGRESEIEAILGTTELIEDGVLNLNLLMSLLADIEAGTTHYQDLLQVFGAGKGGKTFLDLMLAAKGSYFDFTEQILDSSGDLEDKAEAMAESLPAMMTRIKEALTAPFANPEVIAQMSLALSNFLDYLGSTEYEQALASIVVLSSDFLTNMAPQLVDLLTHLIMLFEDAYPAFDRFAAIGTVVLSILSSMPAELLSTVGGMYLMYKVTIPMASAMSLLAQNNAIAATSLSLMRVGLLGIAGGFMLAVTAGDDFTKMVGVVIAGIGGITTAIWALNAAKAFGATISNLAYGTIAVGAGIAAAGLTYAAASSYSVPTDYTSAISGATQISTSEASGMVVDTYIAEQNNYGESGEDLERTLAESGVV